MKNKKSKGFIEILELDFKIKKIAPELWCADFPVNSLRMHQSQAAKSPTESRTFKHNTGCYIILYKNHFVKIKKTLRL